MVSSGACNEGGTMITAQRYPRWPLTVLLVALAYSPSAVVLWSVGGWYMGYPEAAASGCRQSAVLLVLGISICAHGVILNRSDLSVALDCPTDRRRTMANALMGLGFLLMAVGEVSGVGVCVHPTEGAH